MAKDVLITPSEGLIAFSSSAGSGSGNIQQDGDNLVISNGIGDVLLGDGASDVFIGDGTNNVDIVFEQNGEIRDDGSGKNITLGSKTTNVFISGSTAVALQSGGGSVGIGVTSPSSTLEVVGDLKTSSHITASGNISASGDIFANEITLTGASAGIKIEGDSGTELTSTGTAGAFNISSAHDLFLLAASSKEVRIGSNNTNDELRLNKGHITASGNISQSGAGNIISNGTVSSIGPLYQAQVNNGTTAGPRFTLGGLADADSFMSIEASSGINKIDTKGRDFHLFSTAATTGFYFDEDNANIGIQTTAPTVPLQVAGDISASGFISTDGHITASNISASGGTFTGNFPDTNDDAEHPVLVTSATNGTIESQNSLKVNPSTSQTTVLGTLQTTSHITASGNISSSGTIEANGDFIVNSAGRVGINTTSPDYKLDVAGNVGVNEYIYHNGDPDTYLRYQTNQVDLSAGGQVASLDATGFTTPGHITASGNISASGTIQSTGNISTDGAINATSADFGDGNITSVGTIDLDTIRGDGDTNTNIAFGGDNTMTFKAGNEAMITLVQGGVAGDVVTIGDGGDIDFKVSTNGDNTTIFVQGSSDNVGVGNANPTEKLTVEGNISASGNYIGSTQFSITSTTDADYQGDVVFFGGTTSMDNGKIYAYGGDGKWHLSDADNNNLSGSGLLAVALGAASDTNGMLLKGMVTLDHDPGAVGDVLYLSTVEGKATSTAPSGNEDIVRVVGYCLDVSNGQIYFNPDNTFVEVSA